MASKRPLRFGTTIGPGEIDHISHEVEEPATIEDMTIRFYQGPELAVRVRPRRIRTNSPKDLVTYRGKQFIDGDGDKWEYDVSEPVEQGDEIEVEIENVADPDPEVDLTYDVTVEMHLDREGGASRFLPSAVRGWL